MTERLPKNLRRRVAVERAQVYAARVQVAGDKALDRETPDWIVRLAETAVPR